jgi:hypothetical protein
VPRSGAMLLLGNGRQESFSRPCGAAGREAPGSALYRCTTSCYTALRGQLE